MSRTEKQIAQDVANLNDSGISKFNNVCTATQIYKMQTGASMTIQDLASEVDGLTTEGLSIFATELLSLSGNAKGSRRPC